jgi:hypothetical protein
MKLIPLTQNKFAQVDDEDYDWLMRYNWCADLISGIWYAVRNIFKDNKKYTIYMHKEILLINNIKIPN